MRVTRRICALLALAVIDIFERSSSPYYFLGWKNCYIFPFDGVVTVYWSTAGYGVSDGVSSSGRRGHRRAIFSFSRGIPTTLQVFYPDSPPV